MAQLPRRRPNGIFALAYGILTAATSRPIAALHRGDHDRMSIKWSAKQTACKDGLRGRRGRHHFWQATKGSGPRDGRYITVGASDRIAQQIDDLERLAGDGPCVDAIEEETPQIETDLTAPNQWPQLAARVVAETPVRGAMGFRILVDKRKTGALNLFSDTAGVFDTESAGQAIVLASFASVAINAVASGEDVSTLRRGLLSNREIGKAVGMLMMLHGVDEQEAFNVLRRYSQDLNIKLADVARTVIDGRGTFSPGEADRSLGQQ